MGQGQECTLAARTVSPDTHASTKSRAAHGERDSLVHVLAPQLSGFSGYLENWKE